MTEKPQKLSNAQARRLALGAQGLHTKRPTGRVDRRHLRKLLGQIRLLQLDSVPVIARTQHLVLFSRLGPHRFDLLADVAWRDGDLFEAWAHEASLLTVDHEPLLRWQKDRSRAGQTWGNLVRLANEESEYIAEVLAEVTERGPLMARELSDPRPRSGDWWGSRSIGSLALDWLFRVGEIGIRRVGNFEKEFDLLSRIVPQHVLAQPTPTTEDAHRTLLGQGALALGVGTMACFADYYRLPIREARQRGQELVEEGVLVPVTVPGWDKPTFRHRDARRTRGPSGGVLLSPFDPIVWNRPRASALFNFEYRLEIYTPKDKRQFGYYVLPFLWNDRLCARLDLRTNRKDAQLEVLGAYAESHVDSADRMQMVEALRVELDALAHFVGVDRVTVAKRGDLSDDLRRSVS